MSLSGIAHAQPPFEALVVLWADARHGDTSALAGLARELGVTAPRVARGLSVAAPFDAPHHFAVVATTAALAERGPDDDDVARLRAAHRAIVRALSFPGVDGAFRDLARALLAERPRLESLHGRARLIEELRRDVLREPRLPLPDDLDDLVRDAGPENAGSPPIRGLE